MYLFVVWAHGAPLPFLSITEQCADYNAVSCPAFRNSLIL
jgi:hypothetical protein